VFGDFGELDDELERYMRQPRMLSMVFRAEQVASGPVTVRRLREGEAEMMPVRIRSRRGVTTEQAAELLVDAREVAAEYPDDPAVLAALAEAEYDAGNDAEAIAAADKALALDPAQTNAYVQKGYALFRRAAEADDRAAAYREAIGPFVELNRIENDHPLPLVYFHRSFVERGAEPSELAQHGLERAAELAPFDLGLRFSVAIQHLQGGRAAQARSDLVPIAYNPHGGEMAPLAQAMIEALDSAADSDAAAGTGAALHLLAAAGQAEALASAPGAGGMEAGEDATEPTGAGEGESAE
jgi:Flp pilus assembly protein TadD